MTQKDFQTIRGIIKGALKENNKVFKKELKTELKTELMLEFSSFVEDNINPQFTELRNKFGNLEGRFDDLETKIDKDYIDKKVATTKGSMTTLLRKEDRKVNKLSKILHKKKY